MKFSEKLILTVFASTLISCSFTTEGKYSDLLDKYAKGEFEDTAVITEAILEGFSSSSVDVNNLFFDKSTVISGGPGDLTLIFPEKVKLNADKIISDNIVYADMGSKSILVGNNRGFCVFDSNGEPVTVYRADDKEKIDASSLRGDNAVFLSGGVVQELSVSDKRVNRLDPGIYNPPYRKLFRSEMLSSDSYYGIITGIAGSYYISIFDSAEGTSRVKNIAASSFEFNIKNDYVLYLRGGTGRWSVIKYDIPAKKRNELKTLVKITDLFLAEEGFVFISEKRTYVENLSGEKCEAPAELIVKGICRNSIIAEFNGKAYIIDFNTLHEKIKEFNKAKGLRAG